jgi:hypothetical protein
MSSEMNPNNGQTQLLLDEHPWGGAVPEPWRREAYDRIMRQAWPLVVRPLFAHGSDRRAYLPHEVERRLRPVAEHLAYAVVPSAEREAFLAAIGRWASPCPSAELTTVLHALDGRGRAERSSVPGPEKQEHFADMLARVLLAAFACQSSYDQALGMPRRLERHPLELRNGARLWSLHLAARRAMESCSAKR